MKLLLKVWYRLIFYCCRYFSCSMTLAIWASDKEAELEKK